MAFSAQNPVFPSPKLPLEMRDRDPILAVNIAFSQGLFRALQEEDALVI
jgi:hypothetical protein